MRFYADLHVHSKYSRATSRDLDLEHLAHWACRKGIAVVATGDFTHPAWFAELKEKLAPAEPGLFRLAADIEQEMFRTLPAPCRAPVRFMLSVEISTIYKKGDRTRKIHHLIYAPEFETAERISARLARIGNIASDGRPILGLDSRDLLEIALAAGGYLVPAHIWTPWFAALGSQSGFESIVECYGDLADHIFAVETGLSSDPAMNWRVSFLDRYRLVSNSDAHSPAKLGREATAFDCEVDYFAIRRALETGHGYVGTVEFFPEEGKYHLDGHRKCGVRLDPRETHANGGRCPNCGQPLTIGVLHRVSSLADRGEADTLPPPTAGEVSSLVPLPEVLAEIGRTGPTSRTVAHAYDRLICALGPELFILCSAPVEDIARAGSPLLCEAITRLRGRKVMREAGYDGEYGIIRLFDESELRRLTAGGLLFDVPAASKRKQQSRTERMALNQDLSDDASRSALRQSTTLATPTERTPASPILAGLDDDQRRAAELVAGPLLIAAGPGSGKTRVLTHRIAYLIVERGIPAASCLAITFTRRAAAEMRERLAALLPADADRVPIHTFHSLGLAILREHAGAVGLGPGFRIAGEAERVAMLAETLGLAEGKAASELRAISIAKRTCAAGAERMPQIAAYRRALRARNWVDFDDLVALAVEALANDPAVAALQRARFRWLSVDEFQDVDEQQYRLIMLIAPPPANLCAIGDPNQAIYGFRGADASCFERFAQDYPTAATVRLRRNYRSSGTIVSASSQLIAASSEEAVIAEVVRAIRERITIHTAPTERAEAEFVAAAIERMIGGHSFFSIDSGRADGAIETNLSFADFAVLFRTAAQSSALCEALARSGIPFKQSAHQPLAADPAIRALLAEIDEETARGCTEVLTSALAIAAERAKLRDGAPDAQSLRSAIARLTALAETCAFERARFFDAVALASETDFFDPRAERVSLLTLHAAKGLEFAVVFIVGLEDGLLPLRWSEADDATIAEERRLFYVGMTRAKDRLILSRALARHWHGRRHALAPSPFLDDMEKELLRFPRDRGATRRAQDRQLQLF
jgi:DNA helicase II / ATP-dependent DNA helicase PcrA